MALPNGNLLQIIKTEEIKASRAIQRAEAKAPDSLAKLRQGMEVTSSEIIGKMNGLEMRLRKRVERFV